MVISGQTLESWTACLRSFSAVTRISAAFLRSASDSMIAPPSVVLVHVNQRSIGIGKLKFAIRTLLQQCEAGPPFRIEVDGLRREADVAPGNPVEMRLEGGKLGHAKPDVIHSGLLDARSVER